jgi:hypothetical protein
MSVGQVSKKSTSQLHMSGSVCIISLVYDFQNKLSEAGPENWIVRDLKADAQRGILYLDEETPRTLGFRYISRGCKHQTRSCISGEYDDSKG